jgi:hypothetical protein
MSRPTNQELRDEMVLLDEDFFSLTQRVNSIRSLLSKYVEYEQNEKTKK